jgi:adenylate kinase family enzyme
MLYWLIGPPGVGKTKLSKSLSCDIKLSLDVLRSGLGDLGFDDIESWNLDGYDLALIRELADRDAAVVVDGLCLNFDEVFAQLDPDRMHLIFLYDNCSNVFGRTELRYENNKRTYRYKDVQAVVDLNSWLAEKFNSWRGWKHAIDVKVEGATDSINKLCKRRFRKTVRPLGNVAAGV